MFLLSCPLHACPSHPTCPGPGRRPLRAHLAQEAQPICGNQSLPEVPLGPSCRPWGTWAKASPLRPRRGSSLSPGAAQCTPQRACSRCPTCQSRTAYTGRAGCRGSGARDGTGTADSWPVERGDGGGAPAEREPAPAGSLGARPRPRAPPAAPTQRQHGGAHPVLGAALTWLQKAPRTAFPRRGTGLPTAALGPS